MDPRLCTPMHFADGRLTQEPVIGGMIFIDLFGPDGVGHGQVTHVGILESINGDELTIVQGNGKPDPTVVTRTTYHLGVPSRLDTSPA
jgi:hypothetical protein